MSVVRDFTQWQRLRYGTPALATTGHHGKFWGAVSAPRPGDRVRRLDGAYSTVSYPVASLAEIKGHCHYDWAMWFIALADGRLIVVRLCLRHKGRVWRELQREHYPQLEVAQ